MSVKTTESKKKRFVYIDIADRIERDINNGLLKNNQLLPKTPDLARQYNVALVTMQKGLQVLSARDLIKRVPGKGTFVRSSSCTNTVGVVFGLNPYFLSTNYPKLLMNALSKVSGDYNIKIKTYIDFENNQSRTIHDLKSDYANNRLRSLVVIHNSDPLDHQLSNMMNIPWTQGIGNNLYQGSFTALKHLINKGYRKILMISMGSREKFHYANHNDLYNSECEAYRKAHAGIKQFAEPLMLSRTDSKVVFTEVLDYLTHCLEKPDAIFVNHDNALHGVLMALWHLGLNVPKDIGLITHHNKGYDIIGPVELTRISYDPEVAAKKTLEYIIENNFSNLLKHADKEVKGTLIEGESSPGPGY